MLSLKFKSFNLFAYDFLRLQHQHLGMLKILWKTGIFQKIQFHTVAMQRNPTWGACCHASTFKGRWVNETARSFEVWNWAEWIFLFHTLSWPQSTEQYCACLCHQSQEAQQILTYRHTFSWVHSSNTLYFLWEVQHIDSTAITRQRDRIKISSIFLCTEKPFHPMGHRWVTYTSR